MAALRLPLSYGLALACDQNTSETFDGGHIEGQVGFGTAAADSSIASLTICDRDVTSGVFGAHGGYGWQRDRRYLGVERISTAGHPIASNLSIPRTGTPTT